jgi:membrane dipeptidase
MLLLQQSPADRYLDQAKALHAKYPLVDGHNDLPWRMHGLNARDSLSLDISKRLATGQTDIPRLREGGVGAQFWSVYVPVSLSEREAVAQTKEQMLLVYRMAKRYPDTFEIAWTSEDVDRIFAKRKIASMMGMEGGHCINNSLQTLRDMFKLGARYMTLTHSRNTQWADSATDTPAHGGLTEFGKRVVTEMNRLGMLVDLSHVSAETMHDALDIARAPVIFSHSGARGVCDNPRNVPDDVLKRLPKNGGVVMVVIFKPYTSQAYNNRFKLRTTAFAAIDSDASLSAAEKDKSKSDWEKANPVPPVTLKDVADHIDHIRKVAGIDHIGIGSDFDGGGGVDDLNDVSKYPLLTAELLRRGYTEREVAKVLGLNVLRAMERAEAVAHDMKSSEKTATSR